MRGDPAFAARIEAALSGVAGGAKLKRKRAKAPAELLGLDLAAAFDKHGAIELRDRLSRFTNAELAAYVRAKRLDCDQPSKLNKTQLLNVILRSVKT